MWCSSYRQNLAACYTARQVSHEKGARMVREANAVGVEIGFDGDGGEWFSCHDEPDCWMLSV